MRRRGHAPHGDRRGPSKSEPYRGKPTGGGFGSVKVAEPEGPGDTWRPKPEGDGMRAHKKPRPGAERSPGRGFLVRACWEGTRASPSASGRRRHFTVAATHALHGLCPAAASGSTAAIRKYTLDPDGPAPPSVYLVFVQAMVAEYVDGSVELVAC